MRVPARCRFHATEPAGPRTQTDVWLTPRPLLDALGPFDLDPCGHPGWPTAARHYCEPADGLALPWAGRVWCNPPYSRVRPWLDWLAAHGDGVALVFARTDARWFRSVAPRAAALNFLRGRVRFVRPGTLRPAGHAGAPSILVAFGRRNAEAVRRLDGVVLTPG